MSRRYALLLDGGFLKYKLGKPGKPVDRNKIDALVKKIGARPELKDCILHRVYFYDAKPLGGTATNPLDGSLIDFDKTNAASQNKSLHTALIGSPFLSLRFGELYQEGWELKKKVLKALQQPKPTAAKTTAPSTSAAAPAASSAPPPVTLSAKDIAPAIKQKGVDMRIGLDIASLTLKRHVEIIVLVTGDSDFVPAMKFARREGAQLFLITLGQGVKEGMREHADLVIPNP